MDSREQFEAWVVGRQVCKKYGAKLTKDSAGSYLDYRVNDRWLAWKASREAIEITLPEERVTRGYSEKIADAMGFNDGIEYCREAIEDAGLKVKPC